MLDNLYENIGSKIKNWAKWIFVIEAIGAVITGLVLLFTDEGLILYGLLTLVCGPIVAWVGSWILYAFGQLVEDVHAMRDKEGTTEEVKAKRETEERAKREAEEKAKREAEERAKREAEEKNKEQEAKIEQPSGEQCQLCGKNFEHLTYCMIKDAMGTRYRNICDDCIQKHNATKQ